MPVAERQQEPGASIPAPLLPVASDNWPDTGWDARAREGADAGQVSP